MAYLGVHLDDEKKAELAEIAARQNHNLSQIIRVIVDDYIREHRQIMRGDTQFDAEALR